MTEPTAEPQTDVIALAAEVVCAYVANNRVPLADLPALIRSVHAAILGLGTHAPADVFEEPVERPSPAAIKRSISQDGIVSFVDGKSYKTMKRHLTSHGLSPERYRARYGLPADYPMVCPSYSEQRSSLAKKIGLGVPGGPAEQAPASTKGRRKAA